MGIDDRKKILKDLILKGEIKKKENDRLDISSKNLKKVIDEQNNEIFSNQEKSRLLDAEHKVRVKKMEEEIKNLDILFIEKRTILKDEVNLLEEKKRELEIGETNIKLNIEKITKSKASIVNDLVEKNNELAKEKINLEILNKSITNSKNMNEELKSEKDLLLNEVASLKIEMIDLKKEAGNIKSENKEAQKKLDKILTKADYLVRFDNHLKGFEEYLKEIAKRLGVEYQPFQ